MASDVSSPITQKQDQVQIEDFDDILKNRNLVSTRVDAPKPKEKRKLSLADYKRRHQQQQQQVSSTPLTDEQHEQYLNEWVNILHNGYEIGGESMYD